MFVSGVLLSVAAAQSRQYYFVGTPLNWKGAQSFCRESYIDLATIENSADIAAVASTTLNYTGKFSIFKSLTHIHTVCVCVYRQYIKI